MVITRDQKHVMVAWEPGAPSIIPALNHIFIFTGVVFAGGELLKAKVNKSWTVNSNSRAPPSGHWTAVKAHRMNGSY